MKTIITSISLLICLMLLSCENDLDLRDVNEMEPQVTVEKKVENGRFVFTNKESLQTTIDDFQKNHISNVEKEFEKLYNNGYRSHTPIVNPDNEELKAKLSEEIVNKRLEKNNQGKNLDDFEDEENYIADPFLASLVNKNDEIIVNDTIYKFTKEKGLFFTHVKDSTYLFDYFKKEEEKEIKGISKSILKLSPCDMKSRYGGVTRINSKVSRYIRPKNEFCSGGVTYRPPVSSPPSYPQTSEEERMQEIINGLSECSGSTPFFQNIFGKTYVCKNYFGNKHRIKTEFWDQKWKIYASVGIQAKTQRRRFGIWWASNSDEIHIGINRILLKYNFPQPQINSHTHPNLFPANSLKNPIYLWDGKFKVNVNNSGFGTFVDTQLNLPNGKLPFFDFGNDQILNIYIPKLYKKGKYNLNLTTQDITSQSNIKALYKMGIDFLKSQQTGTLSNKEQFAVIYQKDYDDIEVLYFGEHYKKTNDNKIKKKFYSEVAFKIGATWGDQSGWSFTGIKPAGEFFRDYTHYELDFFGMARRGNTWKGNRMINK